MIRHLLAVVVAIVFIGCSSPVASPSQSDGSSLASQFPSPTTISTSSPEVSPSVKSCGETSKDYASRILACLEQGTAAVPSNPILLVYHLDPRLSDAAQENITEIAEWALPHYNGYFTRLKRSATMHVIFPLDSKWCGEDRKSTRLNSSHT